MKDVALLIGNDVNNIIPGTSWPELLKQIIANYRLVDHVALHQMKPFPMLYEEIFLTVKRRDNVAERKVKEYISATISQITPNNIHQRIRQLGVKNIVTTNYDYTLEGESNLKNEGIIAERLYSIFRKCVLGKTSYWHIHGEAGVPMSINLGYEHYGGQLQHMRNYVTSGTNYESNQVHKKSLLQRIKQKGIRALDNQSWIDLFFSKDIHIFGLGLDFIEIDIWWLLTYRARQKLNSSSIAVRNTIYYYTPVQYLQSASYKIELLKANDVTIVDLPFVNRESYYNLVIDKIVELS